MSRIDLAVPDLGGFKDVDVIDVLVHVGDSIEVDTPLITLETEKASLDVPATAAGTVAAILVKRGDKASAGTPIVRIEAKMVQPEGPAPPMPLASAPTLPAPPAELRADTTAAGATAHKQADNTESADSSTELLVLGAGPAGYTAAFRAADLGLQVILVERFATLGGVCLNVGCIPSKALLHAAKVVDDAAAMAAHGISFGAPAIDRARVVSWKAAVVNKLTGGLRMLAKQRKVAVMHGSARFVSAHVVELRSASGTTRIRFEQCIIAAGSEAQRLPGLPDDARIMDSTGALQLPEAQKLLVIGGGIIGLEMACVYAALGTRVSVVELMPQLMPGCDADLVRPLERRIRARYQQILTATKVLKVEALSEGLRVSFAGEQAPGSAQVFDRVLVAIGRVPNGGSLGADAAGINVSDRGFIAVDQQLRTNVPHIFAVGDVARPPMLAHKASHEAKVAAEVAAGQRRSFDARVIPSVAYTDPEIAWVGLTESEAQAQAIAYKKSVFPWLASGRSLALGRDEGLTKLLFDPESHQVLGGGIVGSNAGELISEVALAIEMGADATDIGLTVHPHPTLSETVAFAAEAFEGTLTDLYIPKKS